MPGLAEVRGIGAIGRPLPRAVRSLLAGAQQADKTAVANVGEEAVRMHGEGWPPPRCRCLSEGIPVDLEGSIDVPAALADLFDPDAHLDLPFLAPWGGTRYLLLSADNPERDIVINGVLGTLGEPGIFFSRPITPRGT